MRFPWVTARLEKGGLAMQRVPLIVNTRSRSGETAFLRALDLRKAELVRDRLEGQDQLMGAYPEGHDMRARLEAINLRRAFVEVEEDIRFLTDTIRHPWGTSASPGV